ncbi:hypothetical protein ACU4GR_32830 [Methylobacterium oryzae CBMB20]
MPLRAPHLGRGAGLCGFVLEGARPDQAVLEDLDGRRHDADLVRPLGSR